MNPFSYIKTLTHHAYFIHSFRDAVSHLKDHLKDKFGIDHLKNPDFFYQKFEVLSIDDSRMIKERHSGRPFVEGGKKIFIIEADGMTHEAQNSLLKIFEEPNEDTHFFLIMPSAEILLPTLRSRLQIGTKIERGEEDLKEVEKFLKLSKKEKVDFVDTLAKNISDEKVPKSEAQKFLQNLETILYKKGVNENKKSLEAIIKAQDYMNDRSPSIKQLLEYVALML